jgi:hypothetical protein
VEEGIHQKIEKKFTTQKVRVKKKRDISIIMHTILQE